MSNVENTSGLKPLGRAVLVRTYEIKTTSGLIHIPESVQEKGAALETRALVVEVGPGCWPDEPARAKPGDRVFITRHAGFIAKGTKDGQIYRLINDRDIFAQIAEETP